MKGSGGRTKSPSERRQYQSHSEIYAENRKKNDVARTNVRNGDVRVEAFCTHDNFVVCPLLEPGLVSAIGPGLSAACRRFRFFLVGLVEVVCDTQHDGRDTLSVHFNVVLLLLALDLRAFRDKLGEGD